MTDYLKACKADGLNPRWPLQDSLKSLRLELEKGCDGHRVSLGYLEEKLDSLTAWISNLRLLEERGQAGEADPVLRMSGSECSSAYAEWRETSELGMSDSANRPEWREAFEAGWAAAKD